MSEMYPSSAARILITGGTGFAGSHLVEALLSQGATDIHVTHFGKHTPELPSIVQIHPLNLTDPAATLELFQALQPTQIYNLASFAAVGKSFAEAAPLLQNNTLLQLNVLEALRQATPKARILTIGSAEEYGLIPDDQANTPIDEETLLNPINPYAVSKVTQDLLAQAYYLSFQLQIIRVRPFNHIGERQTADFVVPAFASQVVKVERGEQDSIKVGNLTSVRDFTDVKDMVKAYICLMEKGQPGEVYNVGSGQGWQIQQILDMLLKYSKTDVKVEQDETRLRPRDIPTFLANASKIRALGWAPSIPMEETVQRILNDWRSRT